jgi:hypothetical protein
MGAAGTKSFHELDGDVPAGNDPSVVPKPLGTVELDPEVALTVGSSNNAITPKRVERRLEAESYDLSKLGTSAEIDAILSQHVHNSASVSSAEERVQDTAVAPKNLTRVSSFKQSVLSQANTPPASPSAGKNGKKRKTPIANRKRSDDESDFVLDDDSSGNLDFDINMINDFLQLQRKQTVNVIKNAQVETLFQVEVISYNCDVAYL